MSLKTHFRKSTLRKELERSFRDVELGPVTQTPAFEDAHGRHPETFAVNFTGISKDDGAKVKGNFVDTPSQGVSFMAYGPVAPLKPAATPVVAAAAAEKPKKLAFNFKL